MFAAKIDVCFVSSMTVMTETSDESFSSATKSFVIGASAMRNACGPRTSRSTCDSREAERARRFELPARNRLQRAAIDLALVRRVVQSEAEERGDEGRQADDGGEAVVENEELQQHRRAAHDFDVDRQQRAHERVAVDAAAGDEDADEDRQRHRRAREHDRDERRAQQRRDVAKDDVELLRRRRRVSAASSPARRAFSTLAKNAG